MNVISVDFTKPRARTMSKPVSKPAVAPRAVAPRAMPLVSCASFTHAGRVRQDNQDRLLVDRDLGLFVVADGLGGHPAGDVAADLACRTIHRFFRDAVAYGLPSFDAPDPNALKRRWHALEHAVQEANMEVWRTSQAGLVDGRLCRGMATTVVAMLLVPGGSVIVHAGDSRAYLQRRVTSAVSVRGDVVAPGTIVSYPLTEDHEHGGLLTKAVGISPNLVHAVAGFSHRPGDTFLLCSDGLYRELTSEQMMRTMHDQTPEQAARQLLEQALASGGHDNISGVIIRIDG